MKRSFQFSAFLLLILLIFSSEISARFMGTKQGQEEVKLKELSSEVSLQEMEKSESMTLMGMEACDENGDEECLKRRIIAEAHLDYIYTQHHKP
ncbi:putative phytosulfokines 6 [Citrus sinensis]|uniref:putative phytosulfokines 6 n=1 Tax=Citrus sinensis TaxID=2711 RepID=UPI0003D78665|nr:putative phytosulfokines 6 [Citrus sinensis]KAH9660119.1 putative phytosulfokines 6 [Citrus sinensis]